MSYCITLLVTNEQESAIIALFKEKCWIYMKTGQSQDTELTQMVDLTLQQPQQSTSRFSNTHLALEFNPDSSDTSQTLDCKLNNRSVVETLIDSTVCPGNDYREIKADADEMNNYVDNTSDNETVILDPLSVQENADSLSSEMGTPPRQKRSLKQNTRTIRRIIKTEKGKVYEEQLKRDTVVHSRSKKMKPEVIIKKENKTLSKSRLDATKGQTNLPNKGSEVTIKVKRPDDSEANDINEQDLSCAVQKNDEMTERSEENSPMTHNSVIGEHKTYKCSYCDQIFSRTDHCRRHFKSHIKRGVDKSKLKILDARIGRYKCKFCDEPFAQSYQLNAHLLKEHPDYKPYTCEICSMSFNKRELLRSHHTTHSRPYCCETCGQRFGQRHSLKAHMFEHTDSNLPCTFCEKIFKAPVALKNHVQRAHLAKDQPVIKNHMCETCGHTFKGKNSLKLHMTVHTGEKPYSCETCGKLFARKDSLNFHMERHTDVKSFSCSVCSKCFTTRLYLLKHKQIHKADRKQYPCEHCHRLFTRLDNLRTHLRLHSGIKPYKCQACGKSYNQAACLARHMKSHKHDDDE